ncbi:hypothetical protein [Streptomyces sp. NPDC014733]|uniref:hypothetical protein n=1 Tax=Streptomyces sp. NPDC014733 TaxID=3364885 RepID=UPI003702B7AC
MSEIADIRTTYPDTHPTTDAPVHEAYAFACMHCGHGWEQAYEIRHQVDVKGVTHAVYYADGERVPSPLTSPGCLSCGSTVVRIMRAGEVSKVSHAIESLHQRGASPAKRPGAGPESGSSVAPRQHHWHLSDLLHPFQHHRR